MTSSQRPFRTAITSVLASYFLQLARPLAFFAVVMWFALISSSVLAATLPTNFIETQVASGLTNPTAMAFARTASFCLPAGRCESLRWRLAASIRVAGLIQTASAACVAFV